MKKWWKDPERKKIISKKISDRLKGVVTTKNYYDKNTPKTTFNSFFKGKYIKKEDGCYEFTGHKNEKGYGRVGYEGKNIGAHRLAYILSKGQILDSRMYVSHKCDNRLCINPDHLWLATPHETMVLMMRKNRGNIAKLSQEDRETIKKMYLEGSKNIDLQEKYKVSYYIIDFIINDNGKPLY